MGNHAPVPQYATSTGGDATAKLDQIRAILAAFDWERDDRQYALEEIARIVTAPGGTP